MPTIVDKEAVLRLLRARKLSTRIIALEAGVGHEWLNKLVQGRIADPGVSRLRKVYEYMRQPGRTRRQR